METKLREYYEKSTEKNRLDKELKPLNKEIKDEIGGGEFIQHGEYFGYLQEQDRSKMNEVKLGKMLVEKGFTEAVEFVPMPKKDVVDKLVYDGKVKPEDISKCIDENIVKMLKVVPVSKIPKKYKGDK